MKVTPKELVPMLQTVLKSNLVPMISGSPGVSKSQLISQLAEKHSLKLIDIRLAQCDPSDLNGFPIIDGNKANYIPFEMFPLETDEIPKGKKGFIILLDEINTAPPSITAAAYKIILDRQVGMHALHPKCWIIAAGNLSTDKAITYRQSTALQSRMIHFELEVSKDDWLKWANSNGIDFRITSFIGFKPSALHSFRPDHSEESFPTPRTWEFISKLLGNIDNLDIRHLPILAGTIGESTAREFYSYTQIFTKLPSFSEIAANTETHSIPSEPSVLFATCGLIGYNLTPKNVENLLKYIKRMPVEMSVICIREGVQRNKNILKSLALMEYINDSVEEYL